MMSAEPIPFDRSRRTSASPFAASKWARSNTVGNAAAKSVLNALALYANERGECWPSFDTLASDTDLSRRSVTRAIALLVELGLIESGRRKGKGGVDMSNLYRLRLDVTVGGGCQSDTLGKSGVSEWHPRQSDTLPAEGRVSESHPMNTGEKGGCQSDTPPFPRVSESHPRVSESPGEGVRVTPEVPIELPSNTSSSISSPQAADEESLLVIPEQAPDRFDEFWDVYDKKRGRKACEKKWRQVIKRPGVSPDRLIASAGTYVAGLKAEGKHPTFTKDPMTWLNGEHWEDEIESSQPANPYANFKTPEQLSAERGF